MRFNSCGKALIRPKRTQMCNNDKTFSETLEPSAVTDGRELWSRWEICSQQRLGRWGSCTLGALSTVLPGPPLLRSRVIHLLAPPCPHGQVRQEPGLNRPKLAQPHPQEE